MSHSYVSCLMHYAFSTKDRSPIIRPEFRNRLWAYMGGIARENRMTPLAVGGTDDHAHILVSIPSTLSIAHATQLIKGGSSTWLSETFPNAHDFEWQEGYGAFSIGVSGVSDSVKYILSQEEHHRKKSFQEEFLAILKKHGIDYDPKYVWG